MTTAQPLPGLGDLSARLAALPGDEALARPWRRGDEAAFWLSRGAWALQAIVLWWEKTRGARRPVFWLPDYFCNGSTAALRQGGARLVFYPLGTDLEPDWPACRERAATTPPDLFVLVHYFGRPADGPRARDFCRASGALLIEDAAHALGPAPGIGEVGDFVFYSPHKVLAVPDGSVLLMTGGDTQAMGDVVTGLGDRPPAPWGWLAKRLAQRAMPAALLRALTRRRGPAFADDPPYVPIAPTTAPSALARRLLARQADRLDAFARRRRENARALAKALEGRPGWRVLASDGEAAPYRLVLRCDDAEAVFRQLRRRGCPVESWPDLPPEVLAKPGAHAAAIALRGSLLLLPVHQTAEAESLVSCCA